jgi:hypothetical protein
MSRKEVNKEQAQWENEKKHKDALVRRRKMNEAMHWLFTDEATAHGGLGEYEMRKKGLVPTGIVGARAEDAGCQQTVRAYDLALSCRGPDPSSHHAGNFRVLLAERTYELPGLGGGGEGWGEANGLHAIGAHLSVPYVRHAQRKPFALLLPSALIFVSRTPLPNSD